MLRYDLDSVMSLGRLWRQWRSISAIEKQSSENRMLEDMSRESLMFKEDNCGKQGVGESGRLA